MTIEQPVRSSRQSQTILHDVRASVLHCPNVSGLRFCLATAVDHPKAGNGAGIVVRIANLAAEIGVSDFPIEQNLDDLPFLLFNRSRQKIESCWIDVRRV